MYGLEYSSLIIDVICGLVCNILGLIHYFDVAKPFEKVTGIIGLSSGIIGFVNKYLFDKWITSIIFSCLIIVSDIGLAIFGFLLFKSDGSGI